MNLLVIFACAFCFFIFGFTSSIIGPTLEDLATLFATSVVSVGFIRSGRQIGQMIGYASLGTAADKYDLRILAIIGATVLSIGLFLTPTNNVSLAVCVAIFWGIGHSAFNLAPNVIIGRVFLAKSASIMTVLHGVYGLGSIAGPWFVELIRPRGVGVIYQISAFISLLAGVLYLLITSNTKQNLPELKKTSSVTSEQLKIKEIAPYVLGAMLFSGAMFTAADWLFYFSKKKSNYSAIDSTIALSCFWGALTIGRFLLGLIMLRVKSSAILRISLVASLIGSLGICFNNLNYALLITSAILLGGGLAAIYPILVASASNMFEKSRGKITGYLAAAGAFGAIAIPVLQGWLLENKGWGLITVFLSVLLMCVVLWKIKLEKEVV